MPSEFLRVAQLLFEKYKVPMSAKELVNQGIEDKYFSDTLAGKTPSQTMKSKLSVHVRKNGTRSPFVRTKPGKFFLRSLLDPAQRIYEAPPLNPPPSSERVLVFPSRSLDDLGRFQGISRGWRKYHRRLLTDSNCIYLDRLPAEQNDAHKQILTYILVTRGKKLLAFKRGTYNRVEDFLRGSQCVGFGGHVAESDLTLFNKTDLGLIDSAARELFEELQIPKPDRERVYTRDALKVIGALNDDSSAAGRRHFAFVLNYEVSGDPQWQRPERNEKSITQLRWLEPERDPILLWQFEYWSQLVLREFYPDAIKAQPAFEIRRKRPLTPPHLLCVLGSVGSGKSEATNVLRREFGYSEINSGQVLAQLLDIPPVPETPREKFQALAFKFITRADGPARLAAAIWKAAITAANPRLLVDGIRQMSTLRELNSLADKRKMRVGKLFVHTPPDVAYSFYQGRSGVNLDIHDFLKLREAPVEREVYGMIGTADAVLYNWAGKPMYQAAVRRLMSQVNA